MIPVIDRLCETPQRRRFAYDKLFKFSSRYLFSLAMREQYF